MAKMPLEVWSLKKGLRFKRWIIGLLIFLLASFLAMNSFTIGQFRIIPLGNNSNQVPNAAAKPPEPTAIPTPPSGYLVKSKGCHIPDLSPFEPSAMRYIDKAKPIVCEYGSYPPLVDSNNSAIFVNPEARGHYYNESETVDCCWRSFWRADNKDNEVSVSKDCRPFHEAAFVNDEFVRVECQLRNESVYRDYFAFVPRKLQVEERCRAHRRRDQQQQHHLADSASTNKPRRRPDRKLGVLVVGVDAVSRLNLHRSMPWTIELLRDWGAVEMLGYNKVADNTYPNLVPMLSGASQEEFERRCWKDHKMPYDDCPFLWKDFREAGYRTIFGEDACSMTTFNYLKPGFRIQPTDYYLRPYCVAAEAEIGNTHRLNANLCLGTRLNFDSLLHYARKVADEFADDPYFAFFWQASLTHDYLEYPQLGDASYRDFFDYLRSNDLLRDTALVFMSDHGMRWGSFRQTYQGRLEDSLPFVFVRLPEWWRLEHPLAYERLRINARSLTTPYDLHETLRDLMDPSRLREKETTNSLPTDEPAPSNASRGISFFARVPEERGCDGAGIPEHWCMCHGRRSVSLDDPIVAKLTDFLVRDRLNGLLAPQPRCARLEPASVIGVKAMADLPVSGGSEARGDKDKEERRKKSAPWVDYTVTVETAPGGAVFEGSIRVRADNASMSLVGTVSRLNAYGSQSACVDDFRLRLYCYCRR